MQNAPDISMAAGGTHSGLHLVKHYIALKHAAVIVQLAVRARDSFWHEVLYGTLIDLGAVR